MRITIVDLHRGENPEAVKHLFEVNGYDCIGPASTDNGGKKLAFSKPEFSPEKARFVEANVKV